VATGRLLPDGHIGRMAVLKQWRARGIGGLMLTRLLERAKERGHSEVALSAQIHAVPFYRAHGFVEEGAEYLEAGIRHQAMRRQL
jgi:predicted GNAT family N-acyltransferase